MPNRKEKKRKPQALARLIKEDPAAAEGEFNKLASEEQAVMFLKGEDHDRLKMLEIAHNPRELLEKIPATEIWFTIRRLTPADSLLLIKNMTSEQLQVVGDIEWWRKDKLFSASIYEWLEYISACGMKKMMEWFHEGDWDQILWFFKENIVVYKKVDKETDPYDAIAWPREEAPITYEGVFYVQVLNERYDELLRRYLEVLAKHDMELYEKLCESCIWEIPSQREEEAYEARCRRLAEHGFPAFDEAISIYSPLTKARFKTVKKRGEAGDAFFAPRYPLVALGDRVLFINRVLAEAGPKAEDRFLLEVASIANKLLIADGQEMDKENLSASLIKAIGYVNIGLETVSGGDIPGAASLIKEHWLVSIFQVGLNDVMNVSRGAQKTFKNSWLKGDEKKLLLLEPLPRLIITSLLSKRPKYFTGTDEFAIDSTRDFVSSDELSRARQLISESEFVGRMVDELFLKGAGLDFLDAPEDLRFTGIFITALINGVLNDAWVFKTVPAKKLRQFLKQMDLFQGSDNLGDAVERIRGWILSEQKGLTMEEKGALDRFIEISRTRLVDELGDVTEEPSPRHVHCVWMG